MTLIKANFEAPSKSDYLTFAGMGSNASISHHENLVCIFDIDGDGPVIEVYCFIGPDDQQAMAMWTNENVAFVIRNLNANLTALVNASTVAEFNGLAETLNATQTGM